MPTVTTPNAASSPAARGSTAPLAGEAGADPQLVAEAKQEIRVLVEEIAQLAARDIGPADFYSGFLARIVAAMAAVGGAVWTRDERGRLELACDVNLTESGAEATAEAKRRHAALLAAALEKSQAVLVPPASGAKDSDAGNPTALLLVLVPLIVDDERVGLVEVFQRPGGGPATQRGYLRFLVQMGELAGDYLKSRRLRQLAESQTLWQQLEAFVAGVHRSLDVTETAYTIVNEGRRLIGCDRVSLAVRYGTRSRIEAVSGLDAIDRRSGEVQRLAQLADAVLRTGEPLWSDGSEEALPPQIERPLAAYQDQSHARLVGVLPLVAPGPAETVPAGAAAPARGRAGALVGALIVEQLCEASPAESLRRRASVAAQHSAAALANAIQHSSLPLLPLWKVLGRVGWLVRGSGLAKTAAGLALAGAGVYALATVPTEFEVAARGKLQPAQRREIFAPLDGIVARVPVAHGQVVEAGAILAELASTDLELQLAGLLGRQTTNLERLAALERSQLESRNSARLSPAEENRLAGEVLELRQEAQNIERELALLRVKQEQLVVTAPQRGQVVTWKVQDLLLQRPVMRGQGLMTLANPDGPWELELYLPERRLKHVQAALAAAAAEGGAATVGATEGSSAAPLAVTFALSSHPGTTFRGQVVEVEQVAEVRGDEGNTVLLRVAVDKEALPPLHDQTTVTAKVHCGRTSIGYAWFCDLIETVQSKVLFWWPS